MTDNEHRQTNAENNPPAPESGTTVKYQIEQALQPLLHQTLSDMMRYFGFQKFEFGEQRPAKNPKGEDITLGEWGLVVACDWSIKGPEGTIVSFDDFGPGKERRDDKAKPFYNLLREHPSIVESIDTDENGHLLFYLTDGYSLEILPQRQNDRERWAMYEQIRSQFLAEGELWRFMPKRENEAPAPLHFVMTTNGIEDPGDDRIYELFDCILAEKYGAVRTLLDQGITPSFNPRESQETTLMFAAIESTTRMVRLLLEYGINRADPLPMIAAARGGQIETVQLFAEMGGDVNQRDEIGWTPLMEASSWGYSEIVQFLIENGADVTLQTDKGHTALSVAQQDDQPEIAAYLTASATANP